MINYKEIFNKEDIEINDLQIRSFIEYRSLLLEWNTKINLTAITEEKEVLYKHFLDSLLVLKISEIDLTKGKLIDVGTGAGFPGLPLAIMQSGLEVFLSDSLKKRVEFLNKVKEVLNLSNISLLEGRAEDLGRELAYREKFDFAVARAVSKLPTLLEYTVPFIKVGGYFIAYKGPDFQIELSDSQIAMQELGVELFLIKNFVIEDFGIERNIIIFRKNKETIQKYPRRAGVPAKKPL